MKRGSLFSPDRESLCPQARPALGSRASRDGEVVTVGHKHTEGGKPTLCASPKRERRVLHQRWTAESPSEVGAPVSAHDEGGDHRRVASERA